MRILSLNCQKGLQPSLSGFLNDLLQSEVYDFLLLQEATEEVRTLLTHPAYDLLTPKMHATDGTSQLCIVHRNTFVCQDSYFESFAHFRNDPMYGYRHPAFGILHGTFSDTRVTMNLTSLHLHAGLDQHARMRELARAKDILQQPNFSPDNLCVIAGDFNAGFPGEPARLAGIMEPEFQWITRSSPPTLDSRLSENVPHITNRVAAFFALLNIPIRLKTDHFFVKDVSQTKRMTAHVRNERVSDHKPVELVLE